MTVIEDAPPLMYSGGGTSSRPGLMSKLVKFATFWTLQQIYVVVRVLVRSVLTVASWGRGRTVPPVRNPLLLKSATELATLIRKGELKSEEVVQAYIDRILEVEPYINAIVDRRFSEALKEAKEADELVSSGKLNPEQLSKEKPLLGVPVTIKVLLTVKGLRSTAASLLFEDVKALEDAPTVTLMKESGAIVIATTNSAEMGMHYETNNFVHGKTCNPYDTSRTSGGSSGGEGAIISAAGSVLGLGNDLAGSIRLPCLFNGIFGHKPSRGIVSNKGCFPSVDAKVGKMLYTGPMCRYAEDLNTTMAILSAPNVDRPLKFGRSVNFKDLKIHYMLSLDDAYLVQKVDNDVERAMKKAISYFETNYDTKTRQVHIPLLRRSAGIYLHSLMSSVSNVKLAMTSGKEEGHGLDELIKWLFGSSKFCLGSVLAMSSRNLPLIYYEGKVPFYAAVLRKLEEAFDDMLDDNSVFLFPTFPTVAPYHHEMVILLPGASYICIFNLLGLPVTQCPLGLNSEGLPIGMQIVGRRNNDPLTIACAVELEKAFGGWIAPASM